MKRCLGQLITVVFLLFLCSCTGKKEDNQLIPPLTSPLSREYIGYGVITSSFTHINADPAEDSPSLGYLRRGSLVRVIRRQSVKTGNRFESWVLIDSAHSGWLKEENMNIYNNESQAKTASEAILK